MGELTEHFSTEEALRISETRYRRLFETAQDGILLLNADTAQIEDANPYLVKMLGYSRDELLGKKIWDIGAFKDVELNKNAFLEVHNKKFIRYDNLPLMTKKGTEISVEFVSNLYDCAGIDVIQCNIRDNTKRYIAEIALKATSRALKILSDSNLARLTARTENVLLAEYCRIAVETGGYKLAWIGFADEGAAQKVNMMAQFGLDSGFLEQGHIYWSDTERGRGPTGTALRTGKIQIVDDISISPSMLPWLQDARQRGFQSIISVPFRLPNEQMACLTLYSSAINIWSDSERVLLEQLATDLSLGIAALQLAITKIQYEVKLRQSLEQTVQVIADTGEERDSYTAGHQRRVADICKHIAIELGLSAERIHGLHLAATIHDLGKIGVPAEILAKPRRLSAMEFGLIKEHPVIGSHILREVNFPWPIATIILQHHERIDGSGYPLKLTGDEILLESKILSVADIVEAMASHRPYRAALGIDAALDEIKSQKGITLDAQVVDACLRIFQNQKYTIQD